MKSNLPTQEQDSVQQEMYRIAEADSKCNRCDLSSGCAIFGHSEVPLKDVLLIVVSAYPGREEVKQGITLAPSKDKSYNAGKFFRRFIEYVFDSDERFVKYRPFINHIFLTNAIKCSPNKKEVKGTHIQKCKSWLDLELDKLPLTAPILIAASHALESLTDSKSLYAARRKVSYIKHHPYIVTFNPIEPLRYSLETMDKPNEVSFWRPIPYGEMRWHFNRDIELAKKLVLEYINGKNT